MKHRIILFILVFLPLGAFTQNLLPKEIDKEFLTGRVDPTIDTRFVRVAEEHSFRPVYLNPTVYEAFIEMAAAAATEGISLKVISGTRSFIQQKIIWEKKWKSYPDMDPENRVKKILEFSSMPASSRHHWGTDLDINSTEVSYFDSEKGKAEYQWLLKNAANYGFYQVYDTQVSGRTGYAEEKWHWSYMPLANFFLRAYNEQISYSDIYGFEGAALAEEIALISSYVNGISQSARPQALAILSADKRYFGAFNNKGTLRKIFSPIKI